MHSLTTFVSERPVELHDVTAGAAPPHCDRAACTHCSENLCVNHLAPAACAAAGHVSGAIHASSLRGASRAARHTVRPKPARALSARRCRHCAGQDVDPDRWSSRRRFDIRLCRNYRECKRSISFGRLSAAPVISIPTSRKIIAAPYVARCDGSSVALGADQRTRRGSCGSVSGRYRSDRTAPHHELDAELSGDHLAAAKDRHFRWSGRRKETEARSADRPLAAHVLRRFVVPSGDEFRVAQMVHLPHQIGVRFSRNAPMPSCASVASAFWLITSFV